MNESLVNKPSEKETVPQEAQQPATPKSSGGFFILFGKITLFAILAGALLFGAYFYVKNAKKSESSLSAPAQSAINSHTTPTVSFTPTDLPSKKRLLAGPANGTSFKSYNVEIPAGWTDSHEITTVSDKLILTKDDSSITIYQAAVGGGGCIYKGDPPAQMAQQFSNYVNIIGKSASFRRSWNDDPGTKTAYTVCQKNTTDNSYGSPTEFGAINISAHSSDTITLAEIDSILASLIKQ
jgi:hypothetical protein